MDIKSLKKLFFIAANYHVGLIWGYITFEAEIHQAFTPFTFFNRRYTLLSFGGPKLYNSEALPFTQFLNIAFQSLNMNSMAFMVFFFAVALFGMVQSFGTLTTVAYEGALTIPLLAASAGTGLGTAIAVLGVLKLGAAALLLLSSEGARSSSRSQRSAGDEIEEKKDGLFALIRSMDTLECGKNLVCELETKGEEALEQDEALILSLFR